MITGTTRNYETTVIVRRIATRARVTVTELSDGRRFELATPGHDSISAGSIESLVFALADAGITVPRLTDLERLLNQQSLQDRRYPMLSQVR